MAGWARAQVHEGTVETATQALASGQSPALLIVDLDGTAYAPGALQGLAAVCPPAVRVLAIGTGGSARAVRAVLQEGVEDFRIKPLTPPKLREAIEQLWASAPGVDPSAVRSPLRTLVVAGAPGSGVSTVAVMVVHALARAGRFTVFFDLGLPICTGAIALGVDPRAGLEELVDHPDSVTERTVSALRVRRDDRIAVIGRRASAEPPRMPSPVVVSRIATALASEAHWVVVDAGSHAGLAQGLVPAFEAALRPIEPTDHGLLEAARFERAAPAFCMRASLVACQVRAGTALSPKVLSNSIAGNVVARLRFVAGWREAVLSGTPLVDLPAPVMQVGDQLVAHLERAGLVA